MAYNLPKFEELIKKYGNVKTAGVEYFNAVKAIRAKEKEKTKK